MNLAEKLSKEIEDREKVEKDLSTKKFTEDQIQAEKWATDHLQEEKDRCVALIENAAKENKRSITLAVPTFSDLNFKKIQDFLIQEGFQVKEEWSKGMEANWADGFPGIEPHWFLSVSWR